MTRSAVAVQDDLQSHQSLSNSGYETTIDSDGIELSLPDFSCPIPEERINLFGLDFLKDYSSEELYSQISSFQETKTVAFSNLNTIAMTLRENSFLEDMKSFDYIFPDGSSIRFLSRFLHHQRIKQYAGEDFFSSFLRFDKKYTHFFLGSTDSVLKKIITRAKKENPDIKIAGSYSPPYEKTFCNESNNRILNIVEDSDAQVLWVGLGCPKQEKWIAQNRDSFSKLKLILGVGAAFDFYSGRVKRAPKLYRKHGFEFLYRLYVQPKKTLPRILFDPFILCIYLCKDFRKGK